MTARKQNSPTDNTRRYMNQREVNDVLNARLIGSRCVQAWLGYGSALFLGFGDTVLDRQNGVRGHPIPPLELSTNYADWRIIRSAEVFDSNHIARTEAESIFVDLLGRDVTAVAVNDQTWSITIVLAPSVEVIANAWEEPLEPDVDAWAVRLPDGNRIILNCAHQYYTTS